MKMGVPILGTKAEDVDAAEDRELFDEILEAVPRFPSSRDSTVYTAEEAKKVANRAGLSRTGASFLCTGRTGHADCYLR